MVLHLPGGDLFFWLPRRLPPQARPEPDL